MPSERMGLKEKLVSVLNLPKEQRVGKPSLVYWILVENSRSISGNISLTESPEDFKCNHWPLLLSNDLRENPHSDEQLHKFRIIGAVNFRYVLGVFAALTMIVPTYTALFQNDAKKLVTWHGIGQGGYMLVGIVSGSALGIAGGMFHILNHLTYVTLILFSIAAVEYRTGTTNLNKLGGLIKKQPVAFVRCHILLLLIYQMLFSLMRYFSIINDVESVSSSFLIVRKY